MTEPIPIDGRQQNVQKIDMIVSVVEGRRTPGGEYFIMNSRGESMPMASVLGMIVASKGHWQPLGFALTAYADVTAILPIWIIVPKHTPAGEFLSPVKKDDNETI